MKYVRMFSNKPVVIEAFQFGVDEMPEWFVSSEFVIHNQNWKDICLIIDSESDKRLAANKGEYIIKGIEGEIYPCKEDIFKETYEPIELNNLLLKAKSREIAKVSDLIEMLEPFKDFYLEDPNCNYCGGNLYLVEWEKISRRFKTQNDLISIVDENDTHSLAEYLEKVKKNND